MSLAIEVVLYMLDEPEEWVERSVLVDDLTNTLNLSNHPHHGSGPGSVGKHNTVIVGRALARLAKDGVVERTAEWARLIDRDYANEWLMKTRREIALTILQRQAADS
jgi:hypothetical protein